MLQVSLILQSAHILQKYMQYMYQFYPSPWDCSTAHTGLHVHGRITGLSHHIGSSFISLSYIRAYTQITLHIVECTVDMVLKLQIDHYNTYYDNPLYRHKLNFEKKYKCSYITCGSQCVQLSRLYQVQVGDCWLDIKGTIFLVKGINSY